MSFPNRKYFDLNSSDTFDALSFWPTTELERYYDQLRYRFDGYDARNKIYMTMKHSYRECINNHRIDECKQRQLIEGNPFTRPMGPR